jgi:hypothetical protein
MSDRSHRLNAEQVSLILARAAELDARGDSMTLDALREIAAEAGLDPSATRSAIDEVLQTTGVSLEPTRSSLAQVVRSSAAAGGVGAGLGVLAAAIPASGLPALGLALAYLLAGLVRGEDPAGRRTFLLKNTLTWSGFALGAVAVAGQTFIEVIGLAVLLGAMLTVYGLMRTVHGGGGASEAKTLPAKAPD